MRKQWIGYAVLMGLLLAVASMPVTGQGLARLFGSDATTGAATPIRSTSGALHVSLSGGGSGVAFTDFLQLSTVNTAGPASAACDAAGETGRLYIDSTGDAMYFCSGASGWVALSGASPGAPSSAKYITQELDAGLSAEQSLGALTTGLMLNTVTGSTGVLSTYGGAAACGAGEAVTAISASGATTCTAVSGGAGADTALSNLASVAINAALIPGTAGALDLGSTTKPWGAIWFAGTSGTPGTNQFTITGASTSGVRTVTLPDANLDLSVTTANYVLATGSAGVGAPTLRALVTADLPSALPAASTMATSLTMATGGAIQAGTTATNTILFRAYDVDGTAYRNQITLTSANAPTIVINAGATTTGETDLLVNPATKATGNLIDLQVNGTSKFYVTASGDVQLGSSSASLYGGGVINTGSQARIAGRGGNNTTGTGAFTSYYATLTATSGTHQAWAILPAYNQASGTAANTDLFINRTQTAVGSGAQLLIDAQVDSASKFSVSNVGVVNALGWSTNGTAGVDCTSAAAVTVAKGIVTACSEPVPGPLTQDEINQLRGLLAKQ